jgi:hypothetical protein
MFYWQPYDDAMNPTKEEGTVERLKRWEMNISSFMSDLTQQVESTDRHLSSISSSLGELVELTKKLGPAEKGNIIERAYALALMQERQEMKEHLEELMLGMGTIGEVKEFMAQRPELKAFYDKVVAGTLPETE